MKFFMSILITILVGSQAVASECGDLLRGYYNSACNSGKKSEGDLRQIGADAHGVCMAYCDDATASKCDDLKSELEADKNAKNCSQIRGMIPAGFQVPVQTKLPTFTEA